MTPCISTSEEVEREVPFFFSDHVLGEGAQQVPCSVSRRFCIDGIVGSPTQIAMFRSQRCPGSVKAPMHYGGLCCSNGNTQLPTVAVVRQYIASASPSLSCVSCCTW